MNIELFYPNFKTKAVTFSFDDGSLHDKKLIEILNKYGLKATFNLNSGLQNQVMYRNNKNCSILDLEKNKSIYKGHEIATHTYDHPNLLTISIDSIIKDSYQKDIDDLKKIFNLEEIKGSAYPYGTYTNKVIKILKDLDIKYARTTRSTYKFNLPSSFLTWNPTAHFLDKDINLIVNKFINSKNELSLLYLWGHSYELEMNNKFNYFDRLAKKISEIKDVYFASNIEICEYVNAINSIFISNKRVFNPSSKKIYLKIEGKKVSINPYSYIDLDDDIFLSLIFLGDSLMQENYMDTYPQKGWPQGFIEEFKLDKSKTKYHNYAKNGTSTKSFINLGYFDRCLFDINPSLSNYCFISFGHNDEKKDLKRRTSYKKYQENLNYFIDELEKRNVKVILLTSIMRLKYENNKLVKSHLGYPSAMKEVAKKRNIPLIDLEELTYNYLRKRKYDEVKDLYMIFDKNIYPNYKEGKEDRTHLSYKGMKRINKLIKSQIEFKNNKLIIKRS